MFLNLPMLASMSSTDLLNVKFWSKLVTWIDYLLHIRELYIAKLVPLASRFVHDPYTVQRLTTSGLE